MVGVFNTTTNLNTTSPFVEKSSRSQQRSTKRKPSSPSEGANDTTRTTGLATDSLSVVTDYDTNFPTSPSYSVLTQKGVTKGKVTSKTTPATTTPVFALNGKAVPNTSASGAFTYEIAKPTLLKSGRVKRSDWTTVGVNSVPTTPVSTSSKAPKTTSATTTTSHIIADVRSTSKGSVSPSTTSDMKATNNAQKSSPLKPPKPTGVNFNKQTGNMFQALSDSADCNEGTSAQ